MSSQKPFDRVKYWSILGLLAFVSLFLLAWVSRNYNEKDVETKYLTPFEGKVKAAQEAEKSRSKELDSPGLRESDITKHKGRKYSTY